MGNSRGRSRSRGKSSDSRVKSKGKHNKKQVIMKFAKPSDGGQHNYGTFEDVKMVFRDALSGKIKNCSNLTMAIKLENYDVIPDAVQKEVSKYEDAERTKLKPEEIYEQQKEGAMKTYTKKQELIDEERIRMDRQKSTAFSVLIQEYVTKDMKDSIRAHQDYETKYDMDPVETLKLIRTLMGTPKMATSPWAALQRCLGRLFNIEQVSVKGNRETLLAYKSRFMQEMKIVVEMLRGDDMFVRFAEHTDEYKNTPEEDVVKREQIVDSSWERMMAYIFLNGADNEKYKPVKDGYAERYANKEDKYPRTLEDVVNVLHHHEPDYLKNPQKSSGSRQNNQQRQEQGATMIQSGRAQGQVRGVKQCYCCGGKHLLPQCAMKDEIGKKYWFEKTGKVITSLPVNAQAAVVPNPAPAPVQQAQPAPVTPSTTAVPNATNVAQVVPNATNVAHVSGPNGFTASVVGNTREAMSFFHNDADLREKYKWHLVLDCGSSIDVVFNRELLTNTRVSETIMTMFTNGGARSTSTKGTLQDYGEVWQCDDAIANIIAFHRLADTCRVFYDSWYNKEAFYVLRPRHGWVKFEKTPEGLYTLDLRKLLKNRLGYAFMIESQAEKRKGYTKRQYLAAKEARRLYHALGCPSLRVFKAILNGNFLIDCPVTVEHVKWAEDILVSMWLQARENLCKGRQNR